MCWFFRNDEPKDLPLETGSRDRKSMRSRRMPEEKMKWHRRHLKPSSMKSGRNQEKGKCHSKTKETFWCLCCMKPPTLLLTCPAFDERPPSSESREHFLCAGIDFPFSVFALGLGSSSVYAYGYCWLPHILSHSRQDHIREVYPKSGKRNRLGMATSMHRCHQMWIDSMRKQPVHSQSIVWIVGFFSCTQLISNAESRMTEDDSTS